MLTCNDVVLDKTLKGRSVLWNKVLFADVDNVLGFTPCNLSMLKHVKSGLNKKRKRLRMQTITITIEAKTPDPEEEEQQRHL